jgi:hypothetical protein
MNEDEVVDGGGGGGGGGAGKALLGSSAAGAGLFWRIYLSIMHYNDEYERGEEEEEEGLPNALLCTLGVASLAFLLAGVATFGSTENHVRNGQLSAYTAAIDEWNAFRNQTFLSFGQGLTVRMEANGTMPGPSESLRPVTIPDPPPSDDEGVGLLPEYSPLRFEGDAILPDSLLSSAVPFYYAPSLHFQFGPSLNVGPFPTSRERRVPAPSGPVPENKCYLKGGGVFEAETHSCVIFEQISSLCVAVELHGPDVRPSQSEVCSGEPKYSHVNVDGHYYNPSAVPPLWLSKVPVMIRSEMDPYLQYAFITADTSGAFVMSEASFAWLSALMMCIGVVLSIPVAATIWRRNKMSCIPRRRARIYAPMEGRSRKEKFTPERGLEHGMPLESII